MKFITHRKQIILLKISFLMLNFTSTLSDISEFIVDIPLFVIAFLMFIKKPISAILFSFYVYFIELTEDVKTFLI